MLIDHLLLTPMKVMKPWNMKLMNKQNRCKVDLVPINFKNKKINCKPTTKIRSCMKMSQCRMILISKMVTSLMKTKTISKRPILKLLNKINLHL